MSHLRNSSGLGNPSTLPPEPSDYIKRLKGGEYRTPNRPNEKADYSTPPPFNQGYPEEGQYDNRDFRDPYPFHPPPPPPHPRNPQGFYPQPCLFHPGQNITNFCTQQRCIMPLCPQCIINHLEMHEGNREYAQIVTIDKALADCYILVEDLQRKYEDNMYRTIQFKNQKNDLNGYLKHKISQAKGQMMAMVDAYFKELQHEVDNLNRRDHDSEIAYQLQMADRFAEQKQNELGSMKQKLAGPKFIQYIVRMYSTSYLNENEQVNKQCEQFLDMLSQQFLDLSVDQSSLYNINILLSKYAFLKNANLYSNDERRPDPPNFSQRNAYVHSIQRTPNRNINQDPTFNHQNPHQNTDQDIFYRPHVDQVNSNDRTPPQQRNNFENDFYRNPSSYGQRPNFATGSSIKNSANLNQSSADLGRRQF